jgi:hypothetical protein
MQSLRRLEASACRGPVRGIGDQIISAGSQQPDQPTASPDSSKEKALSIRASPCIETGMSSGRQSRQSPVKKQSQGQSGTYSAPAKVCVHLAPNHTTSSTPYNYYGAQLGQKRSVFDIHMQTFAVALYCPKLARPLTLFIFAMHKTLSEEEDCSRLQ